MRVTVGVAADIPPATRGMPRGRLAERDTPLILRVPSAVSVPAATVTGMTTRIDCDTCLVRGLACHDCVVTVLLGPPPELTFDEDDQRALAVLAQGGLVPPLRLVQAVPEVTVESA